MAASPLPTRPDLPGPRVLGFIACGSVVRRSAYLAAGGFPPGWGVGGEELPLATALADRGWELCYVDELVAHHHPSGNRDPARRRVVAARNDLWFAWARRPPRVVLAETVRCRRGIAAALRGPLPRREPLSGRVERDLRRLSASS
jgi:hypothetical protein